MWPIPSYFPAKWIELSNSRVKCLNSNWATQSKNINVSHPKLAP